MLSPFRQLGKTWEAEKIPTINRVVEGLYSTLANLRMWYNKNSNKRHGVTFAKKLEEKILERFPHCFADQFHYAAANYVDPSFKGVHLKEFRGKSFFDDMTIKLEDLHKSLEVGLEESMEAPGEGDMTQIEPREHLLQCDYFWC